MHYLTSSSSMCPACGHLNLYAWMLAYASFRHLDFTPLGGNAEWPNTIVDCKYCGVLYRLLSPDQRKVLATLYTSCDYAEHKEAHMVRINDEMYHSFEAQADIVLAQWPEVANIRSILDIGCFDGKLLQALGARTKAERLVGYDVAPRPGFPRAEGFKFYCGDRVALEESFDLIVLSQSMIYIDDLDDLFSQFTKLLNPEGRIFVHVPNTAMRPSSLLLGDQVIYFTPASLDSLFSRHGYEIEFISNDVFQRDLLVLAKRSPKEAVRVCIIENIRILEQLTNMAKTLRAIPGNELAILGTTIEAAFAYSILLERVCIFIDENPNKLNNFFNGIPVLEPKDLLIGATCIVPMGSAAKDLVNRLTAKYPAQFIAV